MNHAGIFVEGGGVRWGEEGKRRRGGGGGKMGGRREADGKRRAEGGERGEFSCIMEPFHGGEFHFVTA